MFDYRLYLITDGKPDLLNRVEKALRGGVTIVQYREKQKSFSEMVEEATQLHKLCQKFEVPLIINDYPELAKEIGAEGLHIGQSDTKLEEARNLLGDNFPIGVSARTVEEAVIAEKNGAIYLGVGAVFPTGTKSDAKVISPITIENIQKKAQIPTLLIGGISLDTLPRLKSKYDGLCVISGILGQENIEESAKKILEWGTKNMSFSQGLRAKAEQVWEAGYNHPFVQGIGRGTLPRESFKFYLLQDYLYLIQYAKVFALGALKADSVEVMRKFSESQYFTINGELGLHKEFMERFGISEKEVEEIKPSLFNSAYTANMLAQGQTGGLAELIAATFPCAWTYADYGQRLKADYGDILEGNYYKSWIEMYASKEFEDSFQWFYETLDRLVENMTEEQKSNIEAIFIQSVEFEYLFWDMAYKQQMSF